VLPSVSYGRVIPGAPSVIPGAPSAILKS